MILHWFPGFVFEVLRYHWWFVVCLVYWSCDLILCLNCLFVCSFTFAVLLWLSYFGLELDYNLLCCFSR